MKFLKYLGIFLLVAVGLFLFVVAYASEFRDYACKGQLSSEKGVEAKTITMTLQKYRDWVRLFSDSDGTMKIEIPGGYTYEYDNIKNVDFFLQIYETNASGTVAGQISFRNHAMHLNTPIGVFEGICVEKR